MYIKHENSIYRIYEKDQIGSVEFDSNRRYIENIYLDPKYRGRGFLREIIKYFGKPLIVLPLPQHIDKFKHLGFTPYETIGSDNYYILT